MATSGLEMTQNSLRYNWTWDKVDQKLQQIMENIHKSCLEYSTDDNSYVNYVKSANIAGFCLGYRCNVGPRSSLE